MKIAIEALGIQNFGGPRTAILGMLEGLAAINTVDQFRVFLTRPEPALSPFPNFEQVILPTINRFGARIALQARMPGLVYGFDLVHFTKNLTAATFGVPYVVTVHDLTAVVHPEIYPISDVIYWRYIEKISLRQAKKVIAVSQTTAQDLQRLYQLPADQVQTIYNAISPEYKPASPEDILRVRQKYQIPEKYILHVGRIDVKKNLPTLVKAFDLYHKQSGDTRTALVLVGQVYPKSPDPDLIPTIERLGLQQSVILTGGVASEDLPGLYSGAFCSVMASHHEGFGLTLIEAMACGSPVVAHPGGAMIEVCRGAAEMVDAPTPDLLAGAFSRLANDSQRRESLVQAGFTRARAFQRETNARATLDLYRSLVKKNG